MNSPDGESWKKQRTDGDAWLKSADGQNWLATPDGQAWLKKAEGQYWLTTPDGQAWRAAHNF